MPEPLDLMGEGQTCEGSLDLFGHSIAATDISCAVRPVPKMRTHRVTVSFAGICPKTYCGLSKCQVDPQRTETSKTGIEVSQSPLRESVVQSSSYCSACSRRTFRETPPRLKSSGIGSGWRVQRKWRECF